jgi:hypothetical protein
MEKSEDLARKVPNLAKTRSFIQFGEKLTTRAHMQKGGNLEDSGSNIGRRRPRTGPKWAQADRPRPAGPAHFEAQSAPL